MSESIQSHRGAWLLVIAALGLSLLHLPLLGIVPVSGDEAYYWQCSRHADWSYFDQPPLMIWLIGGSTRLLGVTETATRLPAVAIGLAISLTLLGIGRRLFADCRGPLWAFLGLLATPLFALGTMYSSTDVLLCLFVLLVPPLAAVAILEDRAWLWLVVGLLGGLGGLAKFSAVLYVPVVLLLALLHPRGRRQLRRPEPYAAALLGALAVSPALIWALRHHLDNLTFQLAARHTQTGLTLRGPSEYIVSQFLLASPLLFPLLVVALGVETRRAWRERDLATLSLALPADVFLSFFALVSLWTSSAPHWSAPGIVCGALVTARWVLRRWAVWSPARRLYSGAAVLSGFLLVLGAHSLLFLYDRIPRGLRYDRRISTDAVGNAFGWPELVQHLRSLEGHEFGPGRDALVCDSYTAASLIAFYSAGRYDPLLLATAAGAHGLAYLYWQNPQLYAGRPGIYVGDGKKKPTREAFEHAYGRVRDLGDFGAVVSRGGAHRGYSQTWRILRGERLSSDPGALRPFRPNVRGARQRSAARRRGASGRP